MPSPDEPIQWWRPTWRDALHSVGWRTLALTAVLLAATIAMLILAMGTGFVLFGALLKPVLLAGGGALVLAASVLKRAIQTRHEPFCIYCGYCLTGLPDRYRCPECGRPYTWQDIDDYRRDPQWFIERYHALQKLPPADRPIDTGPARPRRRSRDGTS